MLAASIDLMRQKIFTFFFTASSNCKSRAELGPLPCNQNITKNQLPKWPAAPKKNFSTQMEAFKTWFYALHFWYGGSHWAFKSFLKFHLFILLLAVLGLQCRVGFFLVVASRAPLRLCSGGFLLQWSLLLRPVGRVDSGAEAPGLSSTGSIFAELGPSCSLACGIMPDQGSNLCPLQWQADSLPLDHQGSPLFKLYGP